MRANNLRLIGLLKRLRSILSVDGDVWVGDKGKALVSEKLDLPSDRGS